LVSRVRATYQEFPSKFWVLVAASFIDRLGGTMIYPFFALYITQKFNVGMAQAGVPLGLFTIFGLVGSMVGGALADKIGRRTMLILGLVLSAVSSVTMGLVDEFQVFYGLSIFVGLLSNIGGPSQHAMVADLVPEEKRAEAFGVIRVAANLAWILGPTIGGFLATQSYLYLFIADAIASIITAMIVFARLPETRPEAQPGEEKQSFLQTLVGYRVVAQDRVYMAFLGVSMLMLLVYNQLYNTLSVYLRDVHGIPAQRYGLLMSLNASTVVLFQFWVTRKVSPHPPMLMMALGTGLYLIGFTMYGLVTAYVLFAVAMLIITFGEMIVMPVSNALVAKLAPVDMRGRYMAFFSLAWSIPASIGPGAAGIILDNYNPNWVWYAGGIICAVSILGFYVLHVTTQPRLEERGEAVAGEAVPLPD
jgi:MFS family permease